MVVLTWSFICVCVFRAQKTDSEVKILKKSNAGSFYGVIDEQNDS